MITFSQLVAKKFMNVFALKIQFNSLALSAEFKSYKEGNLDFLW